MKFKIRFADQIVGVFSLFALAALLALIFAIGASQNWFVKKNYYHSYFNSGTELSVGMNVTYKGFPNYHGYFWRTHGEIFMLSKQYDEAKKTCRGTCRMVSKDS